MPLPPQNEWQFQDDQGQIMPWYTKPALDRLWQPGHQGLVKPNWTVLEWGCGWSTIWWAKHVAGLISVDHDPKWADQVSAHLREAPGVTANWKLMQIPACWHEHRGSLFEHYVMDPLDQVAHTRLFDCVIVDGWARLACIARAPQVLKEGGIIIIDNADRSELYLAAEFYHPNRCEQYRQPGHPEWRTDIWFMEHQMASPPSRVP